MEQQVNTQTPKENEIDLLDITIRLYRKFKSLLRGIASILKAILIFMIRKSLYLSLFVIGGVVVGVAAYKFLPQSKVYRSEAIIRSNNLASSIVVDNLKKLNGAFIEKDRKDLSSLLNISESDAKKISRLRLYYGVWPNGSFGDNGLGLPAYYVRSNLIDTISSSVSKYIKIEADVFDEDVYAKLLPGLLYFINNSTFGQELNVIRVEMLKTQIAHAEQGMAALLQQQALVISTQNNKSNHLPLQLELSSSPQKSEVIQLQEAIDELHGRKIGLEQELALFAQPVVVITDFSKTYRFAHKLYIYMLVCSVVVSAFGLSTLALWEVRKKIIAAIYEKA
ncbi:MAG: hypothetical protein LBL94_06870 [Prevotellaceae bacterium]|jgi:hypothetical protein|nr:hypothetical protein [Prevotellaceae bacterium]